MIGDPLFFEEKGAVDQTTPGFSIEIVKSVFTKAGYQVKFVALPFTRQITMTIEGKFAGLVGLYKSDAPDLKYPREPIAMTKNCFYVIPDNNWKYMDLTSLKSIKLGVINGYTYGVIDDYVEKNKVSPNVTIVAGLETDMVGRLFQLLISKRLDTFPEDESVVNYHLSKRIDKIEVKQAGCLPKEPAFIGFSPKLKSVDEVTKLFDLAIVEMRKTGALQKILTKYGASDWY